MDDLAELLRAQDGVVARRQLIEGGTSQTQIARHLRRRELVAALPGVYVEHNGPLTWQQRGWAAVLFAWPAGLSHVSALRAAEGPGRRDREDRVIHVAVDRDRRLVQPPGIVVHRTSGFDHLVQWHLGPPRVRYDEAVLDVAADCANDLDAVGVLADACGARRTTAARLLVRLDERGRIRRRRWMEAVLADVAQGSTSVLERGYVTRVVRPHGLPLGRMQAPGLAAGGAVRRDVEHADLGLAVELDGVLFHSSVRARNRDLDRDLDAAVDADLRTVRLGFGQVYETPCRTAGQLGRLMTRLGWAGEPTGCALCGGSRQPG